MDIDVGKTPPSAYVTNLRDPSSINELDVWIENLMACKQLSEENVQRLCEKVSSPCPPEGIRMGLTCPVADNLRTINLGSRDSTRGVQRAASGTGLHPSTINMIQRLFRLTFKNRDARSLCVEISTASSTT